MNLSFDDMRQWIEKPFAFIERMGLKALVLEPGHVRLMVPLSPNVNHIGSMYAGALFTLAEMPGGALYLTTFDVNRFYPVVKEMAIRFRRIVKTDAMIDLVMSEEDVRRITAEAEKNGKADFVLDGEIKDADGEIVAISHGVYQLRRNGI
jgi:acyl-coenzyme A thioesterase PaaI-like protein